MKHQIILAGILIMLSSCSFITVNGEKLSGTIGKKAIAASGNYVTKNYEVGNFSEIECSVPCDISYKQDDFGFSIYAPDNFIEHLVIEVRNGVLVIKSDGVRLRNSNAESMRGTISCPKLNKVSISGAGDFDSEMPFSTSDFTLGISGAGDAEIHGLEAESVKIEINGAGDAEIERLNCKSIEANINGAGDVEISGRAEKAVLAINGAGDIDISELDCDDVNSRINGIGRVERR